jgi:hypothetical protein
MEREGRSRAAAAAQSRTRADEAVLEIDDCAAREIIDRLARVEGMVRAVQRMIDERRDCHAIVQQHRCGSHGSRTSHGETHGQQFGSMHPREKRRG